MKGLMFAEEPGPVHPNCKCAVEQFAAPQVKGRSDAILVPPGVDLAANIAEAKRVARQCDEYAKRYMQNIDMPIWLKKNRSYRLLIEETAASLISLWKKCKWIIGNFASGKRYDFKRRGTDGRYHPEYEDFGNYHYGLYTRSMGVSVTIAQAGAGAAQVGAGTTQWTNWEYWKTWLDDPHDNAMILRGYGHSGQ